MALPNRAAAQQVSQDDFKSLKETVRELAEKIQKLEQTHLTDEQAHQKDLEQIQQLQARVGQTQAAVTNVAIKAEAAALVQPTYRVPTDSGNVNKNFMILGDAEFQYAKTQGQHGTFMQADFAPIFLYRAGDKILFEAGFDYVLQNNAPGSGGYTTTLNLSFAQLDYLVNDYVTLAAGNLLLPLGTYQERSAGGWLNKFPDDPMARELLPGTGVGAQLRGAVPVGTSGQMVNYAVYGVNGPGSADVNGTGTGSASALDLGGNVGLRSDDVVANLHANPSGGGRLGWFFPYKPHFDLELGVSAQSGEWNDAGTHLWSAGVLDATLHLGPFIEVKGEYIRSGYGSDDVGNIHPHGWWAQAGYKLAGLNFELPGINNVELVGRYDTVSDGMGTKTDRYSMGLIYFITNTLLFEGDYEFRHGNDPGRQGDELILQLGYGF